MAADSIHNFRCALDHLVYAIAIHESTLDPPPNANSLMFPICDTPESFQDEVKKRRLGTISDPVRAAIEPFQPYNRTHPKLPPLLSMLRDFENANKHKLLQLVYAAMSTGEMGFTGSRLSSGREFEFFINSGEIKDGTEVAAFVFDDPAPEYKFDKFNGLLVFALRHKRGIDGVSDRDDATALLELIREEVQTTIDTIVAAVKV
jgi:hypothetical protein